MLGTKHPLIDSHGFVAVTGFIGFIESVKVQGYR